DNVGAAQRVAGHRLQDRAADAEHRTDEHRDEQPRQHERVDDEVAGLVPHSGQRGQHLTEAERVLARGEGHDHDEGDQHRRGERHGEGAWRDAHRQPAHAHDPAGHGRVHTRCVRGGVRGGRCGGHREASFRLRHRARNTGTPRTAVTMPTWISAGGAMIRPTRSAPTSRVGASTSEYGSTHRWSGPAMNRATCGTARPTNPMGPTAAVDAPHSNVMATAPATRMRSGWAPSTRPRSSPMARALRGRTSSSAATMPTAMNGSTGTSTS